MCSITWQLIFVSGLYYVITNVPILNDVIDGGHRERGVGFWGYLTIIAKGGGGGGNESCKRSMSVRYDVVNPKGRETRAADDDRYR